MTDFIAPSPRLSVLLLAALIGAFAAPVASLAAPAVETRSDVKGVSLVALGTLPHSPESGALDDYCSGYRAKTLTALGKRVAKLGWIVTSEAPLGPYRVVSFASGFDAGTSALCFARNANLAVFDGDQLIALAYTPARSANAPLGVVEPLEGGGVLVWTDPPGAPIGELHDESSGLQFTAVAPQRSFCGGQAIVPNIYGLSIKVARKVLMAHGWRPLRPRDGQDQAWLAVQLGTGGIVEAESCAGTGVGYCAFNYRNAAGGLYVRTAGEDNSVDYASVDCAAK